MNANYFVQHMIAAVIAPDSIDSKKMQELLSEEVYNKLKEITNKYINEVDFIVNY